MALHDSIDIYCERLGPGIWAEPLNAVTNMAFIAAAYIGLRFYRRELLPHQPPAYFPLLIVLAFCIGIGSALFHTVATGWAMLADVIPIILFQFVFLTAFARLAMQYRWVKTVLILASFLLVTWVIESSFPPGSFNGSTGYFSTALYLLGMGVWLSRQGIIHARYFWAAGLIFVVSLFFRSVDMAWCAEWSPGTHFLWHIFNGLMIYLVLKGLMLIWKMPSKIH